MQPETQRGVDSIVLGLLECDPAFREDGLAKIMNAYRTFLVETAANVQTPKIAATIAELERAIRERLAQLSEGGSA